MWLPPMWCATRRGAVLAGAQAGLLRQRKGSPSRTPSEERLFDAQSRLKIRRVDQSINSNARSEPRREGRMTRLTRAPSVSENRQVVCQLMIPKTLETSL